MGLLDRWTKRKQKETLEKADENKPQKKAVVSAEEKKDKPAKQVKKEVAKNKDEEKADGKQSASKLREQSNGILIRPLVTEKAAIAQSANKYSFLVSNKANKIAIKNVIKKIYKVSPVAVNVLNVQGKVVRFGRSVGRRSDFRKAIVTLKKGDTIVVHEGV
jgi:large subunit ribosomal protein L23